MKKKSSHLQDFSMYQIIDKKKRGFSLDESEISWMIENYTHHNIPDYQMSAMLMSLFLQGMNPQETFFLTRAMLQSGSELAFPFSGIVDKHSTGGVGDKASFILAPIASAAGVKVPMIAGRGLGHTGGTVDKIEAIPGFKTNLTLKNFAKKLEKNGLVMIGQTPEIAPADKLLYALRDVTATIDSIPLITASIMSKKIAEGANGFVFDIKVGSGAFMKSVDQAALLGKSLLKTTQKFNKKAVALITDMNQPLGLEVGHSNEIRESLETLKGQGPEDLRELSLVLSAHMIHLAGIEKNFKNSYQKAVSVLRSGKALQEFKKLIKSQGGDAKVIDDYNLLPTASEVTRVKAKRNGYLKSCDNAGVGLALIELGGGRKVKSDHIDHSVGFSFEKKLGDKIHQGETLLTITHHKHQRKKVTQICEKFHNELLQFSSRKPQISDLIIKEMKS